MYNLPFSKVCYHDRTKRINATAVKCIDCGQTIINKVMRDENKTSKDFVQEKSHRNFDRNFSNDFTTSEPQQQKLEYYIDLNGVNKIIINVSNPYRTNQPKYNVIVNGETVILTEAEINKLIRDTNVHKILK